MTEERALTATRLKAELLRVLDEVEAGAGPVTVTKHGRPVARIVPVEAPAPMAGSVGFLVDGDALIAPMDDAWHADQA